MRRFILGTTLVGLIGVAPIACNVFVSLERCQSDADCPAQAYCDPEFAFCARRAADSGAPDVVVADTSTDTDTSMSDASDAADVDAVSPGCNLNAPFASMAPVLGLEGIEIGSARLTSNETSVIFSAANGCELESCIDLFLAMRVGNQFVVSGLLPGVNTNAASEYWATVADEDDLLYFESGRSLEKVDGGYITDHSRIWTATRSSPSAQFSEPYIQDIFKVGPGVIEGSPYLPNKDYLYFASNGRSGKGGLDIFVAKLGEFGIAESITNIDSVNTTGSELMPTVSTDERTLYFSREVSNGHDILVTHRSGPTATFGTPTAVNELNGFDQWPSWISDDECRLYFISNRPAPNDTDASTPKFRLWVAEHPKN